MQVALVQRARPAFREHFMEDVCVVSCWGEDDLLLCKDAGAV